MQRSACNGRRASLAALFFRLHPRVSHIFSMQIKACSWSADLYTNELRQGLPGHQSSCSCHSHAWQGSSSEPILKLAGILQIALMSFHSISRGDDSICEAKNCRPLSFLCLTFPGFGDIAGGSTLNVYVWMDGSFEGVPKKGR